MALTMISIPLFSSLILQVRKISVKVRGMGCVRSELAVGNGSFTRRDTIRHRRRPKLSLRGDLRLRDFENIIYHILLLHISGPLLCINWTCFAELEQVRAFSQPMDHCCPCFKLARGPMIRETSLLFPRTLICRGIYAHSAPIPLAHSPSLSLPPAG